MDKKILRQILYKALLTSPIISVLAVAPMYIVNNYRLQTFFEIWTKIFIVTLIWWWIQTFVFSFFKKKGYPNWMLGTVLTLLVLAFIWVTKDVVLKAAPSLQFYSEGTIFILRFSIVSSINLIIYLLLDLIYSRENRVQLVEKNAMLQYDNLESEYKLLKAQINPHFLFNALNISKSLIRSHPKNAEKYIIQLSEFLRNSLNNQQKSISLKKELEHVQQYVSLQKVRFENAFEFLVNIEQSQLEKHLPLFTLTTLVENALKHNAFSEEEPLTISVQVVDGFLEIKNNIKSKKGVVSTLTGLSNLNQRSKMLSDKEIQIENDGRFFLVKIKLIEL